MCIKLLPLPAFIIILLLIIIIIIIIISYCHKVLLISVTNFILNYF